MKCKNGKAAVCFPACFADVWDFLSGNRLSPCWVRWHWAVSSAFYTMYSGCFGCACTANCFPVHLIFCFGSFRFPCCFSAGNISQEDIPYCLTSNNKRAVAIPFGNTGIFPRLAIAKRYIWKYHKYYPCPSSSRMPAASHPRIGSARSWCRNPLWRYKSRRYWG